MEKIVRNMIKCKLCGDIIESKYTHNFKWCRCGSVAVDGGHDYLSRSFPSYPKEDFIEEMSLVEEINDGRGYYSDVHTTRL